MPVDDPAEKRFLMLRQFRDLPDALAVKSILDSAGIECLLGDENIVRLDWLWSNLVGGVKLWVRQEDVEEAENLIEQSIPEEFGVEGVGKFEQPRCPTCGSLDVSFERLSKPMTFISLYLGVPIPLKRERWKCHACGHSWPNVDEAKDRPLSSR